MPLRTRRNTGLVQGLRQSLVAVVAAALLPLSFAAELPPIASANWIWAAETPDSCQLRKTLDLETTPANATLLITADNGYELFVNGAMVGGDIGAGSDVWQSIERYDLTSRLARGRNVIGIQGRDLGGLRGVIAAVRLEFTDQPPRILVTDSAWRAARDGRAADSSHPEFVEGADWTDARVLGPMGMAPWGKLAWSENADRHRNSTRIELAAPGPDFRWPEAVAFLGDDCSVYVPYRADAWGLVFRVGDWSRAYTEFDIPAPAKTGRKLFLLNPGANAAPRLIFDAGQGVIGSPSVSFDGRSLLLAMAREGENFFHIYRIQLTGGEPQRLTDGPFHDLDPTELPDGRIVFASTRIGTFEEYHQPPSRALFRMNSDGSEIHPITSTLIFDNEPKVMADGRIVFIRSDNFFDRGKVETHLHVIRPDGTDGFTEIGANVGADYGVRLRAYGYGSPAPLPDGRLAFISNRGNFIADLGGKENDFQKLPGSLSDLAPLPDNRLLATVLRSDGKGMASDALAVIDPRDGRLTAIYESTIGSIHSPVFVGERERPPVIPDYVDAASTNQPGTTGFLFCQDARFTTKAKAGWNRVRAIRVVGAIPLTTRSSHSHIVHVGNETVELGTVPLAPDGSFFIEVPADTPLALQAVDAEGRSELNEMSWIYVRPGERRSCAGCHQPRETAPPSLAANALALRSPPLKLTGQGGPHRFRGNNAGVTGLMDLQFERFRETASLNRFDSSLESGHGDLRALIQQLSGEDDGQKISAAQRLAIFRAREAAPALGFQLAAKSREVRTAAALALAACGTRDSPPALLVAMDDSDLVVRQAASVALENITGRHEPVGWREWFATNSWPQIERSLIARLGEARTNRSAIVALGHIGGDPARAALRDWVAREAKANPYPVFEKDNRTDNFTFSADSPLNPRPLQEAVRALGHLRDTGAIPLLRRLIAGNLEPSSGNLFLVEAAVEALGRIGTAEAEDALVETFSSLQDYWKYVGWYSDHPALYACHASPLHARVIEALDWIGSTRAGRLVPGLIRSVPTDPDRALFLDIDSYENLVGRLIRRSGRATGVIESCLSLLGDNAAAPEKEIVEAISTTHPAWAGHPGPQNRAAQILSMVCRDPAQETRVLMAYVRFRGMPEEPVRRELGNPTWTPIRHWTLFYLARTLGYVGRDASVKSLLASLADDLSEARHGRPNPSQPEIHFLHLEYTPCWRAASAWAMGRIGNPAAAPALIGAIRNLDNAVDVRHAAARALEQIADPGSLQTIRALAAHYPEISVRKALQNASHATETRIKTSSDVAQKGK